MTTRRKLKVTLEIDPKSPDCRIEINWCGRGDLDAVMFIKAGGEKVTKRQDIEAGLKARGWWFGRKDLLWINLYWKGVYVESYFIDPVREGTPTSVAWDMLDDRTKAEFLQECKRLTRLEQENGWPEGTLN